MEASTLRIEGKVMNFPRRDEIIARFSSKVPIGTDIFDNRNNRIGKVRWIFGPVDDPYYEVSNERKDIKRLSMLNSSIYAEEE